VPVLNEAACIARVLNSVRQKDVEVIVVDGGSTDETVRIASSFDHCSVIESKKGRAGQMNAGAAAAFGDILLFLHADTLLPESYLSILQKEFWDSGRHWGRFDVRLSGDHPFFRVIETMMNYRSRLTGVCTGDQAIFIKRGTFEQLGGFAMIPLMEDVEISKRLRPISPPFRIRQCLTTSSRRWEQKSIISTVLLMWRLRLMYFAGVPAEDLTVKYPDVHAENIL
jgi:rSAM/selenodomain-associated transferase 2